MSLPVIVITPDQYQGGGEMSAYPVEQFSKVLLAQGDSWFSIGAFPPPLTTNLLFGLQLNGSTCIVNCASPGRELRRMADTTTGKIFLQMLNGKQSMKFSGILLSGGGNDLIEALQSTDPSPAKRLLLRQNEWGPSVAGAVRYISDVGWSVFETHLDAVFHQFITARDVPTSPNRNVHVILHTYDLPSPRDATAGFGFGPWICKAFEAFAIPKADWDAVAHELFTRMGDLLALLQQKYPNVHLVDTQGTLVPAGNDTTGPTADWQNEIHPTRSGYKQLSAKWGPVLNAVL